MCNLFQFCFSESFAARKTKPNGCFFFLNCDNDLVRSQKICLKYPAILVYSFSSSGVRARSEWLPDTFFVGFARIKTAYEVRCTLHSRWVEQRRQCVKVEEIYQLSSFSRRHVNQIFVLAFVSAALMEILSAISLVFNCGIIVNEF